MKPSRTVLLGLAGILACQAYVLSLRDGAVWIRDPAGETRQAEDLCPQALPAPDRRRLEEGLRADSLPELTRLLEDLYP